MASAALRARWAARAAVASVLFNTVDASDLPEELDLKPATDPDLAPSASPPSPSPPLSPSRARLASPDIETPVGRFAFPTLGLGVLERAVEEAKARNDEDKEEDNNSRLSHPPTAAASHVDTAAHDTPCSGLLKTVSGGAEDSSAEESKRNPSPLASPVRPEGLLAFRHRRLVRRVTTSSIAGPVSCTKTPATLVEGEAGEDRKNLEVGAVTVTLRDRENEARRPARKILQSASLERPRSARSFASRSRKRRAALGASPLLASPAWASRPVLIDAGSGKTHLPATPEVGGTSSEPSSGNPAEASPDAGAGSHAVPRSDTMRRAAAHSSRGPEPPPKIIAMQRFFDEVDQATIEEEKSRRWTYDDADAQLSPESRTAALKRLYYKQAQDWEVYVKVVQQNGGQPPSFEEYITLELHSALEAHAERPTRMAGAWPWTVAAVEKGKGGQQQAT